MGELLVLEIVGAGVLALLAYLVVCRWSPYRRCPGVWWRRAASLVFDVEGRCRGGWYGAKHQRRCGHCNGAGRVKRTGRRFMDALSHTRRGAA